MNENPACQSCRLWDPKWNFKKEQRYHQDTTAVEASNPRLGPAQKVQQGAVPALRAPYERLVFRLDGNQELGLVR